MVGIYACGIDVIVVRVGFGVVVSVGSVVVRIVVGSGDIGGGVVDVVGGGDDGVVCTTIVGNNGVIVPEKSLFFLFILAKIFLEWKGTLYSL
ncbi:hypothetical protein Tco_0438743 [Tanacetum coccineum]